MSGALMNGIGGHIRKDRRVDTACGDTAGRDLPANQEEGPHHTPNWLPPCFWTFSLQSREEYISVVYHPVGYFFLIAAQTD